MPKFRNEFLKTNKIFLVRMKIWLLVLSFLYAGHFFKIFRLINFNIYGFYILTLIIIISFIPIFIHKNNIRKNYYYSNFLLFLDPVCIGFLLYFSNDYHHVFVFLLVISLFFPALFASKKLFFFITFCDSIIFLIAVYMAGFNVGITFSLVVIITLFIFTLSLISLKNYFIHLLTYLRVKDKDILHLEFFNTYLIDNMENGVITVDQNQKITFCNKAGTDILCKKQKELINKNINDIFLPLITDCREKASEHIERQIIVNDKKICLTIKTSPIFINEEYSGNIIVFDDITLFKENQRMNEQNMRLASIGRLAAALAHELRNPLASISGSVEMLKECSNDEANRERLMKIILREINSLNILICELLDFVKPIKLKRTEFDISKLIEDTVDLIKFEKKIKIEMNIDKGVFYNGDKNKIKQVFLNILKNAIDFLNEDCGKIIIFLKKDKNNKIEIIFQDNGPGIIEDNFDKIFEPFFTTKEKGTGLGLATCQNILVMHGAEITLDSKKGDTKFIIKL